MFGGGKMKNGVRANFIRLYAELEFNSEDTIFQRMALYRLQQFADKHLGTHLEQTTLDECAEWNDWLSKGKSERELKVKIRSRRLALAEE